MIDDISNLYLKKKLKEKFIKAIKKNPCLIKNIDKIKIENVKRETEIYSYSFTLKIPTNIKLENIPFNEKIEHDNIHYNNIMGAYNKIREITNKLCAHGYVFIDDKQYFHCLVSSSENNIEIEKNTLFLLFRTYTNTEI